MQNRDESLCIWRDQIDVLDLELLHLLSRRSEKVRLIGRYKKRHKLRPLSPQRRKAVLNNWVKEASKLQLSPEFVTKLYALIHDYAVQLEDDE